MAYIGPLGRPQARQAALQLLTNPNSGPPDEATLEHWTQIFMAGTEITGPAPVINDPGTSYTNGGGNMTNGTGNLGPGDTVPGLTEDILLTPVESVSTVPADALAVPAVLSLAWLAARLGTWGAQGVWNVLRPLATGPGRLIWSRIPGWIQNILVGLGFVTGVDLLIDMGDGDTGLVTLPGSNGNRDMVPAGPGGLSPVGVVGTWVANGVTFYRLVDGRLAVQNSKGRWKVWRPRRPIVLFSNGASNLKDFIRADAALDRQAKRLRKALDRRAPRRTGSTRRKGGVVLVQESGKGGVQVG